MSSKHLKEVPLLGLAKAKALALSNANLLARNIDPQKISPLPYCQPYIQFCVLPPSIAINLPDIASLRITLLKQELVLLGFFDARDFFGLHLRTTQRKTQKKVIFMVLCSKLTPLFLSVLLFRCILCHDTIKELWIHDTLVECTSVGLQMTE